MENYINKFNIPLEYGTRKLERLQEQQTSCSSNEISVYGSFLVPKSYEGVEMFSKQDFKEFDKYLLLDKGLGTITREGHITAISVVLKRIEKINPKHSELQEHILWMHKKGYSHSHITNTSKAIEYYAEFEGNPLKIAKTRKPIKIVKDCLSEAEVNIVIRTSDTLRKKAMMMTLAYSGVRNKEFCNLKVRDIDFGNNSLRINNGKNSKDRMVNISAVCSNTLVEYLLNCRKEKDEFLFTTLKNNNQYKPSDLRKFVKVLAKKAKIEKRVYPHLFRHSLATNLIRRGANIIMLREQLGHSSILTTAEYINLLPCDVRKGYELYEPSYV